jgi:hypothetical protein
LQKARRGELSFPLPIGYVWAASGEVVFDPDEQVQHVVRLVFRKFEELGTLHALLRYLVQHDIQLGVRGREGPAKGTLEWRRPNRMTLQNLLKHPIYAGAYAYGRRQVDPRKKQPGRPTTGRITRRRQDYHVLLQDHVPAYVTWQQYEHNLARLAANRARADTLGAARHYRLVEPEHRLVARQLAKDWEEKLTVQRQLQEDYQRFLQEHLRPLSAAEREAIRQLAQNIPALWHAPTTTMADRKEIIRQVIHRVRVAGEGSSERLQLTIEWVGGGTTAGSITRPIRRIEHLSYDAQLCDRIRTLAQAGHRAGQIAVHLEQEGYRPPKRAARFSRAAVLELMQRLGVHQPRVRRRAALAAHEWWVSDLARTVAIPKTTLHAWRKRGWLQARWHAQTQRWIVWADGAELERLKQRHALPAGAYSRRLWLGATAAHVATPHHFTPAASR